VRTPGLIAAAHQDVLDRVGRGEARPPQEQPALQQRAIELAGFTVTA
jgi:hypothetical protein